MAKQETQVKSEPAIETPIAQVAAPAEKLYVIECGGLFRYSTYKPASKLYGVLSGHYIFGAGGAWQDFGGSLRDQRIVSDPKSRDPNKVVMRQSGVDALVAYAKANNYALPKITAQS
ncbi:MAG: hypothetical protein KGI70_03580 [Patescibacteria group bacterium]|nr:hypothetical protein [Patescibacteria group bacterium]